MSKRKRAPSPDDTPIPEVREPVSLYDAKTHLSELVELAANGAEIVIMKSGKPMARLGPLGTRVTPRRPGRGKGAWKVAADFDAPLPPDVQRGFDDGA